MYAPVFWMMILKNNSLENGGLHGYNQEIILSYSTGICSPRFLEENEDVKYKKQKNNLFCSKSGRTWIQQNIIWHIQIYHVALVIWIMMLNIKTIKNKSFRWKTGRPWIQPNIICHIQIVLHVRPRLEQR